MPEGRGFRAGNFVSRRWTGGYQYMDVFKKPPMGLTNKTYHKVCACGKPVDVKSWNAKPICPECKKTSSTG